MMGAVGLRRGLLREKALYAVCGSLVFFEIHKRFVFEIHKSQPILFFEISLVLLSPLAHSYPEQVLGYFEYAAILLHADSILKGRLLVIERYGNVPVDAVAIAAGRSIRKLVQKLRKV